jgi:predicted Zn finger-like uncharacterized protein
MMITRCPACGTMFNVVADQLKVSQGWVRCGQCSDVFDASLHLQNTAAVQSDAAAPGAPIAPSAPAIASTLQPLPPAGDINATPSMPDFTDDFTQSLQAAIEASALSKTLNGELPSSQPAPSAEPVEHVTELVPSRTSLNSEIDAEESAAAAEGASFVQAARRQAFWKKARVRVVLVAAALCLLLALALQLVVQQKDYLVMQAPRVKPIVESICGQVGCQLGQLRRIDAIVIDSSSFTKLGTESYKLNFSIKNLGSVAVAMPSLEVTLTDTQDQPLLRRVLLPAQFGAGAALLTPGADFAGSLTLDVSATSTPRTGAAIAPRIAGYRLLAFYP